MRQHMLWRLAIADRLKCRLSGLDDMPVAEWNMHVALVALEAEQRNQA